MGDSHSTLRRGHSQHRLDCWALACHLTEKAEDRQARGPRLGGVCDDAPHLTLHGWQGQKGWWGAVSRRWTWTGPRAWGVGVQTEAAGREEAARARAPAVLR